MPTKETYDDHVIRLFLMAAAVWGVVGMSIGVLAAAQMAWPALNFDVSWLTFSRIRANHTFGVIFAFGGSALMGTCYYIVQRTGHVRLAFGKLALFTFWGWQARDRPGHGDDALRNHAEQGIRRARVVHRPADRRGVGVRSRVVFFGTLARRRIQHIYVSNWYYGALIIAVALLHIVNNLALPVSLTKSYTIYSGAVDAMVQWWYGHNAVAFFLTAGFLGMMYYFVPRQAQQPLWSYRFSIVNFWALISVYMWAGSHHLLYTALPDWVQSVGMVFSMVLIMPSIGFGGQRPHDVQRLLAQGAHRPRRQVHGDGAGLLRRLDVRRLDDGDQVGQLADALHRLDRRARACRRHRLGRDDHHRLAVRDGAARARSSGHAFDAGDEPAFLAAHQRTAPLRDCRCGPRASRRD